MRYSYRTPSARSGLVRQVRVMSEDGGVNAASIQLAFFFFLA